MRKRDPNRVRGFKTPLVPLVPILGMIICAAMIVSLETRTQIVALIWMVLGLVIYFGYSKKNSKLNAAGEILPTASDFEKK